MYALYLKSYDMQIPAKFLKTIVVNILSYKMLCFRGPCPMCNDRKSFGATPVPVKKGVRLYIYNIFIMLSYGKSVIQKSFAINLGKIWKTHRKFHTKFCNMKLLHFLRHIPV